MLTTWDDVDEFLQAQAAIDLAADAMPRPVLLAGEESGPMLMCFLRSAPADDLTLPLSEAAIAAGCVQPSRAVLSVSSRLHDLPEGPPPVAPRALLVVEARGDPDGPATGCRVVPYRADGGLRWFPSTPMSAPELDRLGLQRLLAVAVDPLCWPADDETRRSLLAGLVMSGHLVAFHPEAFTRFGLEEFADDETSGGGA